MISRPASGAVARAELSPCLRTMPVNRSSTGDGSGMARDIRLHDVGFFRDDDIMLAMRFVVVCDVLRHINIIEVPVRLDGYEPPTDAKNQQNQPDYEQPGDDRTGHFRQDNAD